MSNAELSNTAAADDWPTHAVSVGQEGERKKILKIEISDEKV